MESYGDQKGSGGLVLLEPEYPNIVDAEEGDGPL